MAQNLVLNILARDRTKQAFNGIRAGLTNLRASIFSVQSALVGIGGGLIIRSLVNVGSQVENLGLRFNFLFGNVQEGQKAFQGLINFAARVPFSLEEISQASGNLAVVSKDANDLQRILKITGNVAAVTGLDFRTTAEQIQRSFSSGIGAADLFRERGVRALLGFQAGAQVTTEETIKRFEELFGEDGRFSKATEVLSTTFTGTLSMLSDKLFKFRLETNRAGFFDFIKNSLVVVNRIIEQNASALSEFADSVGQGLVVIIKQALIGSARLLDSLQVVFKIVGAGIGGLIDIVKALPAGVRELGIIGFLMLGRRGKIIIASIAGLLKIFKIDLDAISEKIFGAGQATEDWGKNSKIVRDFLEQVDKNILASKEQLKDLQSSLGKVEESAENTNISFRKIAESIGKQIQKDLNNINETIGKFILSGLNSVSRSLAEAVVLGKKLNTSFKELAQKILVDILAFTIQIVATRKIEDILIDKGIIKERQRLSLIHSQNSALKKQMALKAVTSFFGFPGFAKGGAVSKGKPIVVGERGPELFVPNSTGQITQSARGTSGQAVNVNFNISTVDASGFDDLLARSRGTITQIINSAVNERGREALI
jgi:fumarate reductase subunit C